MKKQVKAIFIPSINFQNNQDVHPYFNLGIYTNGGRQRHELYIIDESRSSETINDYVYCSDLGPQKAFRVLPSVKETDHLIIGTTDKVLIDDGVPPISPEFIEEFFQTGFMCIPFVEIVEKPKIDYDGTLALTTTIQTNKLINNQIEKQENNTINTIANSAGEHYKNGFKAGVEWQKQESFTINQMLEAITYGFEYHRDAMNNNVDVPDGNKLQWILGQYFNPLKHKELIESWKKK